MELETKFTMELTRDSVCAGDDVLAPHKKIINVDFILEPLIFITKISEKYLPYVGGKNHKWECVLNDKIIGIITTTEIIPLASEIKYKENNKVYFKYYSAKD